MASGSIRYTTNTMRTGWHSQAAVLEHLVSSRMSDARPARSICAPLLVCLFVNCGLCMKLQSQSKQQIDELTLRQRYHSHGMLWSWDACIATHQNVLEIQILSSQTAKQCMISTSRTSLWPARQRPRLFQGPSEDCTNVLYHG